MPKMHAKSENYQKSDKKNIDVTPEMVLTG